MAKRNKTKGQTIQWPKETRQKDRQYNGQKKQDKRTNNDLSNTKPELISCALEGWTVPAPLVAPVVFVLFTNLVTSHE